MTQHIINVAFDFDDAAISKYIESAARQDVIDTCTEQIMEGVKKALPRYGTEAQSWKEFANEALHMFFVEHKDKIIDLAATALAIRANSSKRWKVVIKEAKMELEDERQ